MEIVDGIFLVKKENQKILGLNPDIEETPEDLVIPEGIEIIGPAAFVSKNKFLRSNIKSVKFPDSLKKIGNDAFVQCTDLTDIQFGNGLECIEKNAFASCRGLEEIVLPDSLRVIESIASRLIATNRNAEAAKFIGLGLLTSAAAKSLYENAVNNGNNDIAAYLMEEIKNDKKPSMKL